MRLAFLAASVTVALTAVAQASPVYTTSVTVPYDPTAPSYCANGVCTFAAGSNTVAYTVRTGEDATNFYVDVTAASPVTSDIDFANIYIGGTKQSGLVFEVENNRVTPYTGNNVGTYYSLTGTGFTSSISNTDISFSIPFAFFETDPLGIGIVKATPGDLIRVSLSQSFGYALVNGSNFDPVTRLGAQIIPAASAVPEPFSTGLLVSGLIGLFTVRGLRQKSSGRISAS